MPASKRLIFIRGALQSQCLTAGSGRLQCLEFSASAPSSAGKLGFQRSVQGSALSLHRTGLALVRRTLHHIQLILGMQKICSSEVSLRRSMLQRTSLMCAS